jgi:hypothetical protein
MPPLTKDEERIYKRNYYLANRDRILERTSKYNREHPEGRRARKTAAQRLARGFTADHFEEMLSAQEWCCAICDGEIDKTAHADHDHNTNSPRGILCSRCNLAVGLLKDNPETCNSAAEYLRAYS